MLQSLSNLEILGHTLDYPKLLSDALKEQCPQRQDVLQLAVPQVISTCDLPICNWCQIIPSEFSTLSPFARFITNVRIQYHHQQ